MISRYEIAKMRELFHRIITDPDAVIALGTLAISVASIILTLVTIIQTRKHNHLSVKPLCHIHPPDYEDRIAVIIQNHGIGPLVTKSIKFYDESNETKTYLIDLMPRLPTGYYWTHFTKSDSFVVPANNEKILIELSGKHTDVDFIKLRDSVRKRLSSITVEYEFTDIYGRSFPKEIYKLSWFGRGEGGD